MRTVALARGSAGSGLSGDFAIEGFRQVVHGDTREADLRVAQYPERRVNTFLGNQVVRLLPGDRNGEVSQSLG